MRGTAIGMSVCGGPSTCNCGVLAGLDGLRYLHEVIHVIVIREWQIDDVVRSSCVWHRNGGYRSRRRRRRCESLLEKWEERGSGEWRC